MSGARTCGLILAGGRARRMGGEDKGLIELAGRPMATWVLTALRPQVDALLINANRNAGRYRALGCPVIGDSEAGFLGPLAGMLSGLRASDADYLVSTPCDSPFVPPDLVARLHRAREEEGCRIAVAHDGERLQPVFCLLERTLQDDLHDWLRAGERKIDRWFDRHGFASADFSDCPQAFLNVNTPDDKAAVEGRLVESGWPRT